jgi:hypothetical protein
MQLLHGGILNAAVAQWPDATYLGGKKMPLLRH